MLAALKGLRQSKVPGPDEIQAKTLKDVAELICAPLAIICNESLWMGVFTEQWKVARVTTMLKSGQQSVRNN